MQSLDWVGPELVRHLKAALAVVPDRVLHVDLGGNEMTAAEFATKLADPEFLREQLPLIAGASCRIGEPVEDSAETTRLAGLRWLASVLVEKFGHELVDLHAVLEDNPLLGETLSIEDHEYLLARLAVASLGDTSPATLAGTEVARALDQLRSALRVLEGVDLPRPPRRSHPTTLQPFEEINPYIARELHQLSHDAFEHDEDALELHLAKELLG